MTMDPEETHDLEWEKARLGWAGLVKATAPVVIPKNGV